MVLDLVRGMVRVRVRVSVGVRVRVEYGGPLPQPRAALGVITR